MNKPQYGPAQDWEVDSIVLSLERYTSGLGRKELGTRTGLGERRAREVISHIRARTIAPIIQTKNNLGADVYKIAENEEELRAYITREDRRLETLAAAVDGLKHMLAYGGQRKQPRLLDPSRDR